ncbi:hypothetical protein BUE76_12525 [Cnuella takakiae]|nr:hypothetical protein BUE76_12525 [Cnuella takakiae]
MALVDKPIRFFKPYRFCSFWIEKKAANRFFIYPLKAYLKKGLFKTNPALLQYRHLRHSIFV